MTPTVERGTLTACVDRFVGWSIGLPSEASSYAITRLHIPMKDDVQLVADLYQPVGGNTLGTVLVRSPYGIGLPASLTEARLLAARGYQVLMSSCRGTSGSGGEFIPGCNEAADGQATVAWMRNQDWYTGSFATLGGSYLGYNQWALLTKPPEDMKTAVIYTGVLDFHTFVWGSGAFSSTIVNWADVSTRMQGPDGMLSLMLYIRSQHVQLRNVLDAVPLLRAVSDLFSGNIPAWLRDSMTQPSPDDPFWKEMGQSSALERAKIPILLTTGWNDLLLSDVMKQYESLEDRRCDVALIVGPWSHLRCQGRASLPDALKWLNRHLAGRDTAGQLSGVRVYMTGAQEWREIPRWPPATKPFDLYLDTAKRLCETRSASSTAESSFRFDPLDPTPSIGVPVLFDSAGGRQKGDSALAERDDIIKFETEPLSREIEVCGTPWVDLHHSTDHPHADLLVLISAVDADDQSFSITEKYTRLLPNRGQEPLRLTLGHCAHRFQKGTRIRLLIAGGSHPRYVRNTGTADSSIDGTALLVVRHTVKHNTTSPSILRLPVTFVGI